MSLVLCALCLCGEGVLTAEEQRMQSFLRFYSVISSLFIAFQSITLNIFCALRNLAVKKNAVTTSHEPFTQKLQVSK